VALALAGCGGGSPTQPTPDPPAPTLACPADIAAQARNGQPATVNFDLPAAQGGVAPVSVACTPAPGASFALGTTGVTCTATDAKSRTGSCSFAVNVTAVPKLSKVTFVAFGDSITEGKTSPDPTALLLTVEESYPFKLEALLKARYIDQTIAVSNEGRGGEPVITKGQQRLAQVLDTREPDVLLLLDGANDLLGAANSGTTESVIPKIAGALESMVKKAKSDGVEVMLATFPPQNPSGSRGAGAKFVPKLNEEIRHVAADERVPLVDLYNGLGGTPVGSVGVDGLHLTDAGYTKVAQIWFDAIRERYEAPSEGAAPVLTIVRPADRVGR
jgi:lysophospholipase L1-like esterase